MRVLGYARRADGEQGLDDLEFAGQAKRLAAECAERGWELVEVLEEAASLRAQAPDRPVLKVAVERVRDGHEDALMVVSTDRLGLGIEWFGFLAGFYAAGRHFIALDEEWDTTTPGGAEAARLVGALGRKLRWYSVAAAPPRWGGRNKVLARHIPAGSSVLDLGAGNQNLRELLPDGCEYQPADVIDAPGVLYCDFNRGMWPTVDRRYDIVVASGLMEYLHDALGFLRRLPTLGDATILTHAVRGSEQLAEALTGWPTHLTKPELEALFEEAGLQWEYLDRWNAHAIYRLHE